jgi:hypothetical protein
MEQCSLEYYRSSEMDLIVAGTIDYLQPKQLFRDRSTNIFGCGISPINLADMFRDNEATLFTADEVEEETAIYLRDLVIRQVDAPALVRSVYRFVPCLSG